VRFLVDVRRYPGSRRHPWFAKEPLAAALAARGIEYQHEVDLGGRRAPRPDSPHRGLREPSFRAYADHMESAAFRDALGRVLALAARAPTCVLCAEAHPSRCHRRLIADALVARGARVVHLLERGRSAEHALAPEARVVDGWPRYDGGALDEPGLFD
jgi:uncharacterized protein (DUF488 family)